jgi:rare lipoprotein A
LPARAGGPAEFSGLASWYGPGQGHRTASGDVFDPQAMTAAHRSLPFGTRLRVTLADTGNSVEVRINDRGPVARGRILDLSEGAARRLGLIRRGIARVVILILPPPAPPRGVVPRSRPVQLAQAGQ